MEKDYGENTEKEEKEEEERRKRQMAAIARKKYLEEKEILEKKNHTSFGKLILAKEKSLPVYSFGQAGRSLDFILQKNTPGPEYNMTDKFKFKKSSDWKIGSSRRLPLNKGEHFDYYDHKYDENYDFGKVPKKWKSIKGGAISLEPRNKYDFREHVPGPGRYEPTIKCSKRKSPAYYLGERTNLNSLDLVTGTNEIVGPGTYNTEVNIKTSKHMEVPKWTIGKDKRKGMNYTTWTKNETYHLYSSVGEQIITNKRSEPQIHVGKSTRENQKKLGMFASMMSKQPTKIRIEHPKI